MEKRREIKKLRPEQSREYLLLQINAELSFFYAIKKK